MLDYATFLLNTSGSFPDFSDTTVFSVQRVTNEIDQVILLNSNYSGILNTSVQDLAITYHVAHNLTIEYRTNDIAAKGQALKKLKTKHDEIEFQTESGESAYDFSNTLWGQKLQNLLNSQYIPLPAPYICYC